MTHTIITVENVFRAQHGQPELLTNLTRAYMDVALPQIERYRQLKQPDFPAEDLIKATESAVYDAFRVFDTERGKRHELARYLALAVRSTFDETTKVRMERPKAKKRSGQSPKNG